MSTEQYQMTDVQFWERHSGHEKEVEDGFNETIRIRGSGMIDSIATAECPACDVEYDVLWTKKICHHHNYGEHIQLFCDVCGTPARTKNIESIGKRSIYQECSCREGWFDHICSDRTEEKITNAEVVAQTLHEKINE